MQLLTCESKVTLVATIEQGIRRLGAGLSYSAIPGAADIGESNLRGMLGGTQSVLTLPRMNVTRSPTVGR